MTEATKKVELVCVIDRSGSMASCKDDAEKGFNGFIKEQRELQIPTKVTLHQFDNVFETVWPRQTLAYLKTDYKLEPRASTGLLDAVGKAVNQISTETDRNVIVVVVTDGGENSSREFTLPQIKTLIEARQELGWRFVFIGAGIDAFADAQAMGIRGDTVLRTGATGQGYAAAYSTLSSAVADSSVAGQSISFDDEDRAVTEATLTDSKS